MKFYVTLKRSSLLAVLLLLVASLLILCEATSSSMYAKSGASNADRIKFLSEIGCTVGEECLQEKNTVIPDRFSDVYENYNSLQKESGFNLEPYKGCKAVIYKYAVIKYGKIGQNTAVANLIVSDGKIIGGDISSVKLSGFMYPLVKPD